MAVQNTFYNGQPQTQPARISAAGRLGAIVPIPYMGQVFFRYIIATIVNPNHHKSIRHTPLDGDSFVIAGMLDGVVDEIIDHLRNSDTICLNYGMLPIVKINFVPLLLPKPV